VALAISQTWLAASVVPKNGVIGWFILQVSVMGSEMDGHSGEGVSGESFMR
jgi:hypothetical protein